MPEAIDDPSGNTQAFQAWVDKQTSQPEPARSKVPLIVGVAIAGAIVVALVTWLALG
jgi:hypothetical protein